MTASVPDPPPAISKWLDLARAVFDLLRSLIKDNLVPFVLLGLALWYLVEQQKHSDQLRKELREDLKESRGETAKAVERCIARIDEKTNAVTTAVKEVKTEVKATTEAVRAGQPVAPQAP